VPDFKKIEAPGPLWTSVVDKISSNNSDPMIAQNTNNGTRTASRLPYNAGKSFCSEESLDRDRRRFI
jgi:hypothetical protein